MATELRTFVDTDVLIDVARKCPRAIDFWQRAGSRTMMTCSVVSVFELLAGCRNRREQQMTVISLATVDIVQIESGDSSQAMAWYRTYHLSQGVGFLDCLIASAARRLNCRVHTLNTKHFKPIPGLRVLSPY